MCADNPSQIAARQPVNRRQFLTRLGLTGVAMTGLLIGVVRSRAFAHPPWPYPSWIPPSDKPPKRGGILTRASAWDPPLLDPRLTNSVGLFQYKHALKNALIPVVTIVGGQFGTLLAGTVIVETIFALPGRGRLTVEAIVFRDYPVVQTNVMSVAGTLVTLNLLVDLTYARLDPRIRYR